MKYEKFKPSKIFNKLPATTMSNSEIESIVKMASAQFSSESRVPMKLQMANLGIPLKK